MRQIIIEFLYIKFAAVLYDFVLCKPSFERPASSYLPRAGDTPAIIVIIPGHEERHGNTHNRMMHGLSF